jgi:hypothetical protein
MGMSTLKSDCTCAQDYTHLQFRSHRKQKGLARVFVFLLYSRRYVMGI